MSYFDDPKNVEDYIKMAEGYDGRELIDTLTSHLPPGATVLELGMGPGKDFELLSEHSQVTGSDYSATFIERYRQKDAAANLLQLDAVTLDIDRTFNCIYSNKVLHHLSRDELRQSFQNQARVLNDEGLLFHSFWYGDKEEEFSGLRFVYYTEATLAEVIGDVYEIVESERYTEMDEGDSFYVVLRKRG